MGRSVFFGRWKDGACHSSLKVWERGMGLALQGVWGLRRGDGMAER